MKINPRKITDKRTITVGLNLTAIVIMAVIISVGAGYTVLIGDDFTNGVRIGAFHVPLFTYIGASLDYVKSMYMDWQAVFCHVCSGLFIAS